MTCTFLRHPIRAAFAAGCAAVVLVGIAAGPSAAEVTAVDGDAAGVQVDVTLLGGPITLAAVPTVLLPATGGGPFTATLASVNLPGVLTTGLLSVDTQGGNLNSHSGFATSNASVADVNVVAGLLTADAVTSTCTSNGDGSTGSTTLANAAVAGIGAVSATPAPNTTISVPGVASITLNEQTRTDVVGSISTITVTAIHVHLTGVLGALAGDVYVSRSRCQVTGPDVLTVTPADPPTDSPTNAPADPPVATPPTATPPTATPPTATPATPIDATPHFTG